jgi:hypothetical protein
VRAEADRIAEHLEGTGAQHLQLPHSMGQQEGPHAQPEDQQPDRGHPLLSCHGHGVDHLDGFSRTAGQFFSAWPMIPGSSFSYFARIDVS